MSFILDALRKSETERQHKGSAEFANVPTSNSRREGPPAWLWVLGGLLLINLAVLIGILLRPNVTDHRGLPGSRASRGLCQPRRGRPRKSAGDRGNGDGKNRANADGDDAG